MKNLFFVVVFLFILSSCSTKNQLIYLKDIKKQEANSWVDLPHVKDKIESGDILKIDVNTTIPEASLPYNTTSLIQNQNNLELIKLDGYIVENQMMINFPVLGKISTQNLNEEQLELKIKNL